jgi:hypothetical protein
LLASYFSKYSLLLREKERERERERERESGSQRERQRIWSRREREREKERERERERVVLRERVIGACNSGKGEGDPGRVRANLGAAVGAGQPRSNVVQDKDPCKVS